MPATSSFTSATLATAVAGVFASTVTTSKKTTKTVAG